MHILASPAPLVSFKSAYGNFIDGRFVEPLSGEFFMNTSPVDGSNIAQFPRSDARDIDFALDAAHRAAPAWGKTLSATALQAAAAGRRSY